METAETLVVLNRRWWYVLPAVFITYRMAYLDRASYGFGVCGGLMVCVQTPGRTGEVS